MEKLLCWDRHNDLEGMSQTELFMSTEVCCARLRSGTNKKKKNKCCGRDQEQGLDMTIVGFIADVLIFYVLVSSEFSSVL